MEPDPPRYYPVLHPDPIPKWFFHRNRIFRWTTDPRTGRLKVKRISFLPSGFRYIRQIMTGDRAGWWEARLRWWIKKDDGMTGRKPDYEFCRSYRHKMAAVWAVNLGFQILHPDKVEEKGVIIDSRLLCDPRMVTDLTGTDRYYLYVFGDLLRSSIEVSEEIYDQMMYIPLFWRSETKSPKSPKSVFFLIANRVDEGEIPRITTEWIPLQALLTRRLSFLQKSGVKLLKDTPFRKPGTDIRNYLPECFCKSLKKSI